MEKLLASKNGKVSNYIPDDLSFSILSKLPVKSFMRFGCVAKSWSLLFQNHDFKMLFSINLLSNNCSYYNDTSLLLVTTNSDNKLVLYSLFGEKFKDMTKLVWPNPFQEDDPEFEISGSSSINGIICLISNSQHNIRVVLWNPTTEELKVIPTSPNEFLPNMNAGIDQHGFGYDSVSDDYKVIRQISYFPQMDCDINEMLIEDICFGSFWEIYSLRSNSWRKLEFDIPITYEGIGVFLDGMYHWWGESTDDDYEVYILSFDLSNEVFLITNIPSRYTNTLDFEFACRELAVLNGNVALILNYKEWNNFHISILGEIGVKESWIYLFNIWLEPGIHNPITVGKKGDIFCRSKDDKLVCFDLSTQEVVELNLAGHNFWSSVVYKKSLLPIEEINR